MQISKMIAAAALAATFASPAMAFGPVAAAGALSAANADADANSRATGGSASSKDDSTTVGVGLGQAPTAGSDWCAKGTKFGFGALEWTDYSSKCMQFRLAIIAEQAGNHERANLWVQRAEAE